MVGVGRSGKRQFFFTTTCFDPKNVSPKKKCVNCEKCNLQQNSVNYNHNPSKSCIQETTQTLNQAPQCLASGVSIQRQQPFPMEGGCLSRGNNSFPWRVGAYPEAITLPNERKIGCRLLSG